MEGACPVRERYKLLEEEDPSIDRKKQCKLLNISRTGSYYKAHPRGIPESLEKAVKELYDQDPCTGIRKLLVLLRRDYGLKVGRRKIEHCRRKLGIRTIYSHPDTSAPAKGEKAKRGKYPYLLKEMTKIAVDEVWTSDITYLADRAKEYLLVLHYGLGKSGNPLLQHRGEDGRFIVSACIGASLRYGSKTADF